MDNFINDFLVATAFAQQIGSGATAGSVPGAAKIATFTSFDLVKILVVPVGLWFIKGILVYSIERVHLIRHLYAEIELEMKAISVFHPEFEQWKAQNIDIKPPVKKSEMKLIKFEPQKTYVVYHSSQSLILKALWGREIKNIHNVYTLFRDIQVLIGNVADILADADEEFAIKNTNDFKLIKSESTLIIDQTGRLVNAGSPRSYARDQFYSWNIYWFPGIAIAVLILVIFWLLGSL